MLYHLQELWQEQTQEADDDEAVLATADDEDEADEAAPLEDQANDGGANLDGEVIDLLEETPQPVHASLAAVEDSQAPVEESDSKALHGENGAKSSGLDDVAKDLFGAKESEPKLDTEVRGEVVGQEPSAEDKARTLDTSDDFADLDPQSF